MMVPIMSLDGVPIIMSIEGGVKAVNGWGANNVNGWGCQQCQWMVLPIVSLDGAPIMSLDGVSTMCKGVKMLLLILY